MLSGLAPTAVDVRIACGPFADTVNAGSFVRKGTKGEKYAFKGTELSMSFDFLKGKFKVTGKGLDMDGTNTPVHVEIQIDDVVCQVDLDMTEKLDKSTGLPKQYSFSDKTGKAGSIGWAP